MANKIKLCTYNCTVFKSSECFISEKLCGDYNLIALQETWLLPHELQRCDNLHEKFCAFATSAVDTERGMLRGRPYGGLAWMWSQELNARVKPMEQGDDFPAPILMAEDRGSKLRAPTVSRLSGPSSSLCRLRSSVRSTP